MANKNFFPTMILLILLCGNPIEVFSTVYMNELNKTKCFGPIENLTVNQSTTNLEINWYDSASVGKEEYQITIYINGTSILIGYSLSSSYSVYIASLGLHIGDHIAVEVIKICDSGTQSSPTVIEGKVCQLGAFKLSTSTQLNDPDFECIVALEDDLPIKNNDQTDSISLISPDVVIIKSYPNPSFGMTNIQIENKSGEQLQNMFIVHTVSGETVLHEYLPSIKENTYSLAVDLSNCMKGVYQMIIIDSAGKRFYSKLVLQN